MRLGRRASVLAAFSLLASAATAYAECAWILWRLKDRDTSYVPTASFDARGPCIDNLVSLALSAEEKGSLLFKGAGYVRYKSEDGSVTQVHCFPDTVDPRGPTGR